MGEKIKAIMFAAGKSTRTYPLTANKPKPLLKVLDTTIIKHNIEQIRHMVDEIIIVVGFGSDMIKEHLRDVGLKISYVTQKQQLGTGHALLQCEGKVKGDFIVISGDDIYSKVDLFNQTGILAKEVSDPEQYGVLEVKGNQLIKINEKQKNPVSNLVNCGYYVLNEKIFDILKTIKKSERGEIELTDAINKFVQTQKFPVRKVKEYWFPITFPWSILEANVELLKRIKLQNKGTVETDVTIKGDVHIGEGTIIKSGSYIEGPVFIGDNCEIGPFAHIRKDTIIGNNCRIGKMELYDVLIMDGTTSKHVSYAAHSVIGENVNIGAGTITADYRHDGKNHFTIIKGKKVDSGRRKLGAFIGDNVNTGIGTLIYPGRKIWSGLGTLPGEIVKEDKK